MAQRNSTQASQRCLNVVPNRKVGRLRVADIHVFKQADSMYYIVTAIKVSPNRTIGDKGGRYAAFFIPKHSNILQIGKKLPSTNFLRTIHELLNHPRD